MLASIGASPMLLQFLPVVRQVQERPGPEAEGLASPPTGSCPLCLLIGEGGYPGWRCSCASIGLHAGWGLQVTECQERAPNCCEFSLVTTGESESYALPAAPKPQGKEESLAKAGYPGRVPSLRHGSSRGIWWQGPNQTTLLFSFIQPGKWWQP